jgi:hypothetical protein
MRTKLDDKQCNSFKSFLHFWKLKITGPELLAENLVDEVTKHTWRTNKLSRQPDMEHLSLSAITTDLTIYGTQRSSTPTSLL